MAQMAKIYIIKPRNLFRKVLGWPRAHQITFSCPYCHPRPRTTKYRKPLPQANQTSPCILVDDTKMLAKSFEKLTTSVRRMHENLDLNERNPGRCNRAWKCLCERTQTVRVGLWRVKECLECQKAPNFWIKNLFLSKARRMYRYTLVVYRYTLVTVQF